MPDGIRNRLGLVVGVVVVVLLLSASRTSLLLTDLWWYQALDYQSVFTGILATQAGMGVVFGLALALLVAVNLWVAVRMRPTILPANRREAVVERYRQMAEPYIPWLIAGVSGLFALSAGSAVATQWPRFLLWRNGGPFGQVDPQFGRDVGFFVFDLPWLQFLQGWLFTSLLMILLVTVGAHYLLGSIRLEDPGERVTSPAKAHLSVLLAALLAVHGWGYWLGRFQLNYSTRGQVTGASYTDVNAELPALNLLLVVVVVAIVLVAVNIRRRGWLLPGAAIGLLVLASIVLQGIYPAAIQRLRVDPQELQRETEFIERNLEATREAWGVGSDTPIRRFEATNDLDEQQIEDNEVTINNVRLWDPAVLETTYAELQALRPYYRFNDVDVDRYDVEGELRQVMLSARELDVRGLPPVAQTWQNQRLIFTHGMGTVASQVNIANAEGQPVFLSRDIPPRGDESITPELPFAGIYYGETNPRYSIVQTDQAEIDYETPDGSEQITTNYVGEGGVPAGTWLRRLAFAVRFADPNFVLSGLIRPDSEVLFERDVSRRVQRVAPYLELDGDPYPVILGERIIWIQDAYTVSNHYPYSERRGFAGRQVNYIRNSVKAAVDAYDGTVTLYVNEPDDPIVQAWRKAFPETYADLDEAPEGLREHFRYPQDMFTAQAQLYTTYHIPDVPAFYSKADAWEIPRDASTIANAAAGDAGAPAMEPYYLLMRLPGEETEEFVLIQPYLAREKPNMIAWLAGRSDPGHHGELLAVQFPSDQTILGPQQAQARIEQNDVIAEYITLRDQAGSDVIRGNLLVIPIERSILYVEPLFIESPQARIPQLERVVVVMGERTVMRRTLEAAIAEIVGAEEVPEDVRPGEDPEDVEDIATEDRVNELVSRALEEFAAADEALRDGDLAEYQQRIQAGRDLLQRAAEEGAIELPEGEGEDGDGGGADSPSPTPTEGDG